MTKVFFVEGLANSGKSTIIRSITSKLLLTGNFDILYSDHEDSLDLFVYVLKKKKSYSYLKEQEKKIDLEDKYEDYYIINSATDDEECIDYLGEIIDNYKENGYPLDHLLIITSIRFSDTDGRKKNTYYHAKAESVLKERVGGYEEYKINIDILSELNLAQLTII